MTRVLVTGASGFLGVPVVERLVLAGHDVHVVSRRPVGSDGVTAHQADLLERGKAERVARCVGAEVLLHLAWETTPAKFWNDRANIEWVESTFRLVEAFAVTGRRVVVVGSCAEYDLRSGVCIESVTPTVPATFYGVAKNVTHELLRSAGLDVELCWARVFYSYGPREPREKLVGLVVSSLLAGVPVRLGPGTAVRDYLYVDDVADALVALADSTLSGPVNVASGVAVTVGTVAEAIGQLLGKRELIHLGGQTLDASEPFDVLANVDLITQTVGWTASVPLAEGIERTVRWWYQSLSR